MREQRLQRNLKILVVGLGVLILLGLGALAIRMTQVADGSKPAPAASVAVAGADWANSGARLPAARHSTATANNMAGRKASRFMLP